MLALSIQEIFLRAIPEGFLFLFAVYAFSKTALNIKRYLISSGAFAVIAFSIRFLPIQYGVHTILSLIAMIILSVNINKIDIIRTISASIMALILEFICEGINIFIIQYILRADMNYVFKNPTIKILYGIPSLIIFAFIVILFYIKALRKNELRDVANGENC